MGHIFISYAREDHERADRLAAALREIGFDVWIDRAGLATGDDISSEIESQISRASAVLVLWSQASKESTWVRGEAHRALEYNRYFGVTLEPVSMPVPFNVFNAPNLEDWTGSYVHRAWERLVSDLAAKLDSGGAKVVADFKSRRAGEEREIDRLVAATQEKLPFDDDEALDVGPKYNDVERLIEASTSLISSARRLELSGALLQESFEQELIRNAAFVVSQDPNRLLGRNVTAQSTRSILAALDACAENDLIVVMPGRYDENLKIRKNVRIVGVGGAEDRPWLAAISDAPAVTFSTSARLENVTIETRLRNAAVHCESGQPVMLRCSIMRFSRQRNPEDAALYIAGRANPIVIACGVTSADCPAVYFVTNSGGHFIGADIRVSRGKGVFCRGRPTIQGGSIEAVGGHALDVRTTGYPTITDCHIESRGASVVHVADNARPRVQDSRVHGIRQTAFQFEDNSGGRFERNIIVGEAVVEMLPPPPKPGIFDIFRRKNAALVASARRHSQHIRHNSSKQPLFVANKDGAGASVGLPT